MNICVHDICLEWYCNAVMLHTFRAELDFEALDRVGAARLTVGATTRDVA